MTIVSSISTALKQVDFSNNLPPAFLESFSSYKDLTSSIATVIAIFATSYYVFTNVLELDKPKGYRDIPKLSAWKTIYYHFKSLPMHVKYERSMKDVLDKHGISRVNQFGTTTVQIATPEYVHQMLMNTDLFPKIETKTQSQTWRARFFGDNVVFANGEMWRRQRRVCNPAFHRSWSTNTFGERTNAMLDVILSNLKDGKSSVNMGSMAKRMTLDALGKIAFDHDFNSVEDLNGETTALYHKLMEHLTSPFYFFFPSLEKVPFFRRDDAHKDLDKFEEFLLTIVAAKREKLRLASESGLESNDDDLLSFMIKAQGGDKLSDKELLANMLIFFIAGHDTTANAVACALYHIATNPDIQDRLHAEITGIMGPSVLSNGTPIPTVDESKDMELLNAVMKETMRMSTSVELLLPRVATAETAFGPYTIPAGTRVQVHIQSMHTNPKYWDRPEVFNPDRFMNNKEGEKKGASAWVPFAAGSRICIGINFSLIEQRVALSMLVHRFKLSLPADSPHKDGIKFAAKGIKSAENLFIQFTPRY